MTIAEDITPKVTEVRFENIGEEVVAKIVGSSMWFVYNVSIECVNGNGKDLKVDIMSSSESEVQTRMREANIVHEERVSVRVKTHFQNFKYLPSAEVPAKTTVCIFFVFLFKSAKYNKFVYPPRHYGKSNLSIPSHYVKKEKVVFLFFTSENPLFRVY